MRYSNVEKWANCRDAVVYDFVEDTQKNLKDDLSNDYRNLESYEKFFIYKLTKPNWDIINQVKDEKLKEEFTQNKEKFLEKAKQYADIKDPDNYSDLLQNIYKELWPDLVKKEFMKHTVKGKQGKPIASDTMTSAMTRFADAMKKLINDTAPENADSRELEVIKKIRCIYEACDESIKGKQEWWSTNFSIIVIAFLGEEDREKLYQLIEKSYPCMKCFLNKCHQIGNYCPVPAGFNSARSGNNAKHDYWDLTLMKIREWYLSVDKKPLYQRDQIIQGELLHDNIYANALYCMRWLEYFGQGETGWHNFVDSLYMQDYVYNENNALREDYKVGKDDAKYYDVIPFWVGHKWEEPELPKDIDDINQGLKEVCIRIAARSIRIVNACKDSVEGNGNLEERACYL